MPFCDTSAVDWDAVGALGTWAVGIAACWVALKANGIAASLRQAEQERNERASRAIAAGLRIELLTYCQGLRRLADRLTKLSNEWDGVDVPGHAAAAFEEMGQVALADSTHVPQLLSSLPPKLARRVSQTFAVQKKARGVFAGNANYMREQQRLSRPDRHQVTRHIADSAADYQRTAKKLDEVVAALGGYLGIEDESA